MIPRQRFLSPRINGRSKGSEESYLILGIESQDISFTVSDQEFTDITINETYGDLGIV